jgi:predicted NBD/HSP70 family sugar kinase
MLLTVNRRAVVQLIESGLATSQTQLARLLGVQPNSIHLTLKRLEKAGVVYRDRLHKSGRGRPRQHYRIKKQSPVLVIQWDGSTCAAGIVLADAIHGFVPPTDCPSVKEVGEAIAAFCELRDASLVRARLALSEIVGIVLAINATRAPGADTLVSSVMPWIGQTSAKQFSEGLGCTVQLETQSPYVVPELRIRVAEGVRSLAVLNVADGVSAHGAVLDPQWGSEVSYRGELGHVVVEPRGPLCGCGHRGCLEALISGPRLLQRVEADAKANPQMPLADVVGRSPSKLFSELERLHATRSDPYAVSLLDEFLDRVAWCISVVANGMGPDVVVLSGYALEGRNTWRDLILEKARKLTPYGESSMLRLEFPRLRAEDYLKELARRYAKL